MGDVFFWGGDVDKGVEGRVGFEGVRMILGVLGAGLCVFWC